MTQTRGSRAGGRSSSGPTVTWVTSASGAPRSRSWWSSPPGWGWSVPATCSVTSDTRSSGWTPYSCTSRWVFDSNLHRLKAARLTSCLLRAKAKQYDIVSSRTNLQLLRRFDPMPFWFIYCYFLISGWQLVVASLDANNETLFVYSLYLSCLHCTFDHQVPAEDLLDGSSLNSRHFFLTLGKLSAKS